MSEWTPIKLGSIVNITNGFAFKSEVVFQKVC